MRATTDRATPERPRLNLRASLRSTYVPATVALWVSLLAGSYTFDRLGIAGITVPLAVVLVVITALLTIVTGRGRTEGPADGTDAPPGMLRPVAVTMIIVGVLGLSVTWSLDTPNGFLDFAELLLIPLFVFILVELWRRGREDFLKLMLVLVALTGAAYTALGLAAWDPGSARLAVLGGGPNVYSRIVALGVCATIYLMLMYRLPLLARIGSVVLPALGVVAIVLSGSRGGLFSLVVGLVAIIVAATRSLPRLIAYGFFALLALLIIPPRLGGTYVQTYWETRFVDATFTNLYFSRRDELWLFAWDIFRENPIWGIGYGSYGYLLGQPRYYPHNLFLDVMAAAGFVGLLVLLGGIVALVWRPVRHFRDLNNFSAAFLTLSLCIFAASQVSGSIFDSRLGWVFLACAYLASFDHGIGRERLTNE